MDGGKWKWVNIGVLHLQISHQKFLDDIVLFCQDDWETFQHITIVLAWFRSMSGLKINGLKICIYGVGVRDDEMQSIDDEFGFSWRKLPFV